MISKRRSWTIWLAVLPLSCALIGCGGGDKPKAGAAGGSKSGTSTSESGGGEKTGGGAEKSGDADKAGAKAATVEGWGTIKGTVSYDGYAPEPKFVHKAGDQNVKDFAVCAAEDMPSEEWVVSKDGGIRWVLVYVDQPVRIHPDMEKAEGEVEFGQQFCRFNPHMLAYRAGQKLKITSSDPVGHNTNMQPLDGDSINPLLSAATEGKKTEMEGPDWKAQRRPFPVKCNVHGWMTAHVMIFKHPYFAVTDEHGNFEIKNVPAGTVKVVSWQESVGYGEGARDGKDVEVTPDGVAELKLKFKAK